ncbi:MAG: hypothetical protein Kow0010_09210 [Dehalococcoidia bacterium]
MGLAWPGSFVTWWRILQQEDVQQDEERGDPDGESDDLHCPPGGTLEQSQKRLRQSHRPYLVRPP